MGRMKSIVAFLLLGTLWGSSFVATEMGLPYFPPVVFAALRYDIAGLALFLYAVATTEYRLPRSREDLMWVTTAGAFIVGAHHALLYLGQQYTTATVAAIVISLGPIMTFAFARTLLEASLDAPQVLGVLFGFGGVVLVTNPVSIVQVTADAVGVGLVFASMGMFALGSVLTRSFQTSMPLQSLQAWAMLLGAIILHAVAFGTGEYLRAIEWNTRAIFSVIYLGVISGALAFLLYFQLLDWHGPVEINLVGYLQPVIAAVLSWILFERIVDISTVVGFGAILLGFLLIKQQALRDLLGPA